MSEEPYMPPVAVAKVRSGVRGPERAYEGDACYDLFAAEARVLSPAGPVAVPTGVAVDVPRGFVGLLQPRSGLALRHGVQVLGGVIDPGFTGEVMAILQATEPVEVREGDAVVQLHFTVAYHPALELVEWDELAGGERGDRGFNSSNR